MGDTKKEEWACEKNSVKMVDNMCWCSKDMNNAYAQGQQNANGKEKLQYQPTTMQSLLNGLQDFPDWLKTTLLPNPETTRQIWRWGVIFLCLAALAWMGLVYTGQANTAVFSVFH